MEALIGKENTSVLGESEGKNMKCQSNYEDDIFEVEWSLDYLMREVHSGEDAEVNILDFERLSENALAIADSHDTTESTSSFSDTGVENDAMSGDDVVVSELRDGSLAAPIDGSAELSPPREKKVTSHWRKFVHSLAWRCKWTEMQIRKHQLQILSYDKFLADNPRKKLFQLKNLKLEDMGGKPLPFSEHIKNNKILKRKKRKRVEDTKDTAAYMSQHYLFSYYDNRKSTAAFKECGNNLVVTSDKNTNWNDEFGVTDELLSAEFSDGDDSMEQILSKIAATQSKISDLKTRAKKVMSENAVCSNCKMSMLVPCSNVLTRSNGDKKPVVPKLLAPECNMDDRVLPKSAVSSLGEVTHLPDMMIKVTDQPRVGGLRKNTQNGILLHNRRAKKKLTKDGISKPNLKAKEEVNNFEKNKIERKENLRLAKKEQKNTIPSVSDMEKLLIDDQCPKIRSIAKLTAPTNKRKRGTRKPGSGIWSTLLSV